MTSLIIPEYKIELLNKSKKILDKVENINKIYQNKELIQSTPIKKKKSDKVVDIKKVKKN